MPSENTDDLALMPHYWSRLPEIRQHPSTDVRITDNASVIGDHAVKRDTFRGVIGVVVSGDQAGSLFGYGEYGRAWTNS